MTLTMCSLSVLAEPWDIHLNVSQNLMHIKHYYRVIDLLIFTCFITNVCRFVRLLSMMQFSVDYPNILKRLMQTHAVRWSGFSTKSLRFALVVQN